MDRNYSTSELMGLSDNIDLDISTSASTKRVTLHHVAAQESITEKIPVHCGCKDEKTWCATRRCACFKASVKCFIACHGKGNKNSQPDCPNISNMTIRTQKGHRQRDQETVSEGTKRRRVDRSSRGQQWGSQLASSRKKMGIASYLHNHLIDGWDPHPWIKRFVGGDSRLPWVGVFTD